MRVLVLPLLVLGILQGMVGYCRLSVRRDVALVKYMARVLRGELHHPAVLAALRLRAPDNYVGARRRIAMLEMPNFPNVTLGEDFGYDGSIGPSYWGERYRECTGKHQSPININILRVKQVTLPDIVFTGFDDSIDDVHVSNNGHTVLIEVKNEPHPRVRGGPLEGDYIFSQMHFHWGDNDTFGSEDKINHKSFPMELHMVFFKEEYKSVAEAVKHVDGLTVLAFFYELDRHQHPAYDDIVSALGNVTDPHTSVIMSHPFSFLNILPYDLKRYFTYRGSLTTPPCSEVVIWLDFEQPVRLTHEQIEAFRELKSVNGKITHNFRPIQPLGDRVVFYNIDNSYFTYNEIDEPEVTTKPSHRRKGHSSGHMSQGNFVHLILVSGFLLAAY